MTQGMQLCETWLWHKFGIRVEEEEVKEGKSNTALLLLIYNSLCLIFLANPTILSVISKPQDHQSADQKYFFFNSSQMQLLCKRLKSLFVFVLQLQDLPPVFVPLIASHNPPLSLSLSLSRPFHRADLGSLASLPLG